MPGVGSLFYYFIIFFGGGGSRGFPEKAVVAKKEVKPLQLTN